MMIEQVRDVVRGIKDDQWGDPTPCAEWDVRALTRHVFQVVTAVRLAGDGGPIPADLWNRDLGDADFEAAARAEGRPPAGPIDMGGQVMPGPVVASMLGADLVLHGWDLARATGQEWDADPGDAERFLAGFAAQGRQMGLFAAPVPVPAGAPALDRVLGLSGRDPAWRAETR
jgi:uncharacterized protein (TIGR03086 family)